jgi:hypothetical protein
VTSRGTVRIECATDRPHRELVEIRDGGGRRIGRVARGGRVRGLAGRVAPGGHPLVRSLTAQLEAYGRRVARRESRPARHRFEGVRARRGTPLGRRRRRCDRLEADRSWQVV